MKVAVVIPAHNAERYLAETVESVLAQTYSDWELVIVDDGSADRTGDIAASHARLDSRIRAVWQENGGLASARNRGHAETDPWSPLITFLDADDVWEPCALSRLVEALGAMPDAIAVHGLGRAIDERSQPCAPGEMETWGRWREGIAAGRLRRWSPSAPTTLAVLAFRNVIITPGVALLRRRAVESAGLFDGAMNPCEDWDMWLRLSLRGPLAYLDRVVLGKRLHAESMSADSARMEAAMRAVRRKLLTLPEVTGEQRRVVRKAYGQWARRQWTVHLRAAHMAYVDRRRDELARALRCAWLDGLCWATGRPAA